MISFRSITTQHFLNSLLILVFVVGYVVTGTNFTNDLKNDGEMINIAGSVRYRSYRLLALAQQAHNPAFSPASPLPFASEEIERIRTLFATIRKELLKNPGSHAHLIRQLQPIIVRWENELVPRANELMLYQGGDVQGLVRFQNLTEAFVKDVDVFVTTMSDHSRSQVYSFQNSRILFVMGFLPIFFMIAYYSRKHLVKPILTLQNASQRLMDGDFSIRLPIIFQNEVGTMTERFNQTAAALEDLFTANRNYSVTLSELNRASIEMISMGSQGDVYQFACNTARALLTPDMVWLGLVETDSSRVRIISRSGDDGSYTEGLIVTCDNTCTGNGPVGMAIKTRKPQQASIHDSTFNPGNDLALSNGYKSILAIPLVTNRDCIGALTLYSKQPDFFNQERIELCQIFANHTSAAIEAMNLLRYVVFALARAAEANDEDTGNHILRVGEYCALIAEELGLDHTFVEQIRFQATLHDVGKLHTDSLILKKQGPLTPEEWEDMRQHTTHGARIIGEHPMLLMAHDIALCHHERWDGSGYPAGLNGEQIPLSARITTIADQYDALRNPRAYKLAFDHKKTFDIITTGDGRTLPGHFDPEVLAAFSRVAHRFDAIYERLA